MNPDDHLPQRKSEGRGCRPVFHGVNDPDLDKVVAGAERAKLPAAVIQRLDAAQSALEGSAAHVVRIGARQLSPGLTILQVFLPAQPGPDRPASAVCQRLLALALTFAEAAALPQATR